jgi:hypothetical protein
MPASWYFTVHKEGDTRTLYGSTNRFLKQALLWIDHMYVVPPYEGDPMPAPRPAIHGALFNYDRLLPIELKCLQHRPAEELMRGFLSQHFSYGNWRFFDPSSSGGLIRLQGTGRYGGKFYGVTTGEDTSTVKLIGRMYEFLAWFEPDETVPDTYLLSLPPIPTRGEATNATVAIACRRWADAFMHANDYEKYEEGEYYGHRVPFAVAPVNRGWRLYNYVHCGNMPRDLGLLPGWSSAGSEPINPYDSGLCDDPPVVFPGGPKEAEKNYGTLRHRYIVESIPDSWWVFSGDHGMVCQAFELLATASPSVDSVRLQAFARELAHGIWHERLRQDVYLMPSHVTPKGPLFEQDGRLRRPVADTDSLYWVHPMYKAYEAARYGRPVCGADHRPTHPEPRRDLSGADSLDRLLAMSASWWALQQRLLRRRKLVSIGLPPPDSVFTSFPDAYLPMALAATIEWILRTWRHDWGQFGWVADYEGRRPSAEWNSSLGDDGKYNTLRILIGAFRATHDPFYLQLFERAWQTYEKAAREWTPADAARLGVPLDHLQGLIPRQITEGHLSEGTGPDGAQTTFVGLLVEMYNEARAAGITPRFDLLASAESLADFAMSRLSVWHDDTRGIYGLKSPSGHPLVQLAIARGTLRVVTLLFPEEVERFSITNGGETQWFEVPVPSEGVRSVTRAVIYMDDGIYTVGDAMGPYTVEDELGALRPTITVTRDATFMLRRLK